MNFSEIEGDKRYEFRKAIFKSGSSKSAWITRNSIREDIQMNLFSIAVHRRGLGSCRPGPHSTTSKTTRRST
jgi:hypothetical protein